MTRAVRLLSARQLVDKRAKPKAPKQTKVAEDNFEFQLRAYQLEGWRRQQRMNKSDDPFNPKKYWAFDFVWVEPRLIVEIDGGIWMEGGGAHSHPADIERNMRKRNDAALFGWPVLAFTPDEVRAGTAIQFTIKVLHALRARQMYPETGLQAMRVPTDELPF